MILSDLRSYLQQHQRVSMADLVTHFHTDAAALRGMLEKWKSKGYVRVVPLSAECGTGCCQCDPLLTELYEWVNK
jgi:putative ferrous iron transport protein C